jgi:hypothetical protein
MENGSILILRAPFLSRRMAREFFFEHSRRCHRRTTAKTISKYMYTASRMSTMGKRLCFARQKLVSNY